MSIDAPEKKSYKESLNLPQTSFPMEAKLVQNEPKRLEQWQAMHLYKRLLITRSHAPKWVLHDGPPFANGDIHLGHVINKTLKDVFMRFKSMAGFQTPYVPGWDCHGLPIEHKITSALGSKARQMSIVEIRQLCHQYADKYTKIQSEQFQRLGILGDWGNPYLTMNPEYEAETLEVFARFVEAGLVYKQLKPVHWSIANQTALADAELEYKDVDDNSVYVEFPAIEGTENRDGSGFSLLGTENGDVASFSLLIWTTTPWTLPANMAIAVHPDVEYAFVKYTRNDKSRVSVVAKDLVERVFKREGVSGHQVLKTVVGKDLVGVEYQHPFMERVSKVVHAEYVTTTDGTGLVHTAPGHGEDDYHTGITNGIEVYCPVLANGRFDTTVPAWLQGATVWEGNTKVTDKLKEFDVLFAQEKIRHSYPHDWRSKTPTIFRATEQWFVAMDEPFHAHTATPSPGTPGEGGGEGLHGRHDSSSAAQLTDAPHPNPLPEYRARGQERSMRDLAKDAIQNKIDFIPAWGKARLQGMLETRPDWCISRQRAWGLPIPVFYNEQGEALLTPESVRAVARRFREKGSDTWFTESPVELLGMHDPGPKFPKDKLRKEKDIFDVWFESGSSWHAVLEARQGVLHFPADLYLEGSDQHRGWFQLSLLPSLGARGVPPFKQVLTHGFIVKPDGTKVSKSDKEYVTATKEVNMHGADLLRLWCCSVDYQGDIPVSPQVIKEFGDKYRKIRNTLRYVLSNLYDFNVRTDSQEIPASSLDGWASHQLDNLIIEVTAAYEAYQLHRVFRLLHDFCSVQISAVYGNAMKDRLYCELPNAPLRRRCQMVMYRMALSLTKLLAPMIVFTADEAWEHIQHKPDEESDLASVHLALLPKPSGMEVTDDQREEWRLLMELRDQAMLQIDPLLRKFPKQIKPLDMEIVYRVSDDRLRQRLQAYGPDLEDIVGAGCHSFAEKSMEGKGATVEVFDLRDKYKACARSWKRRPDVGQDADFSDLSLRDAASMRSKS